MKGRMNDIPSGNGPNHLFTAQTKLANSSNQAKFTSGCSFFHVPDRQSCSPTLAGVNFITNEENSNLVSVK